jgi:hypothetical protein
MDRLRGSDAIGMSQWRAWRQMRKLRNRGLTSVAWADDKGGAEMLIFFPHAC